MSTVNILGTGTQMDVYDVLEAFNVKCPATQGAIAKLLVPCQDGRQPTTVDIAEAKASLERALTLQHKRNSAPAVCAPIAPAPVTPSML